MLNFDFDTVLTLVLFAISWYRDVTPDMELMQELRLYSRDIANNILARLCKVSSKC